jgi:HD-GYP domain-containing protein (c-di-GMP phosphodiesterase class II)
MNIQNQGLTPGYFKVRIDTIYPGVELNFDLYIRINSQLVTYIRRGDKLSLAKQSALKQKDSLGDHFFIAESDRWNYRNFMRDIVRSDQTTTLEKANLLRESALGFIEEMFEQPDVHKALDDSKPLIQDFINLMEEEPSAMADLISLSSHDFYTYNHSLDVAIYSLGLGRVLSLNKDTLIELGVGALFHDIGKRLVKLDILCKNGALDEQEWLIMQQHPQFGLDILIDKSDITPGIIAACYEHHEAWSGTGYPQKLMGEEIHPFGRIIAITDTFDAMTTQRSYNIPMPPEAAVTMMRDKLIGRYDPEMIKAMSGVLFRLESNLKVS